MQNLGECIPGAPFVPPIPPYEAADSIRRLVNLAREYAEEHFRGLFERVEHPGPPDALVADVSDLARDSVSTRTCRAVQRFWLQVEKMHRLANLIDRDRIGWDSYEGLLLRYQLTVILVEGQRCAGGVQRHLQMDRRELYRPDSPLATIRWTLDPVDRLVAGHPCLSRFSGEAPSAEVRPALQLPDGATPSA